MFGFSWKKSLVDFVLKDYAQDYSVEEESGFFPGFQEVELKVKDIGNRFSSVLKLVFRTKVSPERKKIFVEQILFLIFPRNFALS